MPKLNIRTYLKINFLFIISAIFLLFLHTGCTSSKKVSTLPHQQLNPLYSLNIDEVENQLQNDGDLVYAFIYDRSQYKGYCFSDSSDPGQFMLFKDNGLVSIHTHKGFRISWEILPGNSKKPEINEMALPYENGIHHILAQLIKNDLSNPKSNDEMIDEYEPDENLLVEDGLSWTMMVSIGIPSGMITSQDTIDAYMSGAHTLRKWVSVPLEISSDTALLHMGSPDYKVVSRDNSYEIWEYNTIMTTVYISFRNGRLEWKFNDNEKVNAYFDRIKMIHRLRFRNML